MEAVEETAGLYEVERRARHAVRPGFRITELQISPTQEVPWHYHNNIQDTFYVLSGAIRILLSDPPEEVQPDARPDLFCPTQAGASCQERRRLLRRVFRAAGHR